MPAPWWHIFSYFLSRVLIVRTSMHFFVGVCTTEMHIEIIEAWLCCQPSPSKQSLLCYRPGQGYRQHLLTCCVDKAVIGLLFFLLLSHKCWDYRSVTSCPSCFLFSCYPALLLIFTNLFYFKQYLMACVYPTLPLQLLLALHVLPRKFFFIYLYASAVRILQFW